MKKLLAIIDYQIDFISGSLGFQGAEKIEPKIIELIKQFESNHDDIVFTLDVHDEDYLNSVEGSKLPIKHCIKGTKGQEISDGLKPYVKDYPIFEKNGFGCDRLAEYAKLGGYKEIYLCGLVSDICVFVNAITLKSFVSPYTKIYVFKDATASCDLTSQQRCFDVLKYLHIEII